MWFESTSHVVLGILTVAAVLCFVSELFSCVTRQRWPVIEHALWIVVLLKLIIPPFLPLGIPGFPSAKATMPQPSALSFSASVSHPSDSQLEVSPSQAGIQNLEETQRFPDITAENNLPASPSAVASTRGAQTQNLLVNPQTLPPASNTPVTHSSSAPSDRFHTAAVQNSELSKDGSLLNAAYIGWSLCTLWAVGSLVVLFRAMQSIRAFTRLLPLSEPVTPEVQSVVEEIAVRTGLRKVPTVRTLQATVPPLVWSGIRQILVILPADLSAMHEPTTRNLLLTHEFAHIRRRDYLTRWLELAVTVIWWWCPLVWLTRSRLRAAEEAACDAQVLTLWPDVAEEYARAIVETTDFVAHAQVQPQLATGGTGSIRQLKSRLKLIESQRLRSHSAFARTSLVLVVAALTCPLLLVGSTVSQTVKPPRVAKSNQSAPGQEPNTKPDTPSPQSTTADSSSSTKSVPPVTPELRKSPHSALPPECRPSYNVYAVLSPDGLQIAFTGRYTSQAGTTKYGLFCYDRTTRNTRCLIENRLNTRAAWSPDSKKLAIGNSPGKSIRFPLVIIDVQSGQIDETGVQGAGAAWSPNGRYIAVSTQFAKGSAWRGGIPADGRIGIWDTVKREMNYVSLPGINQPDRDLRYHFITGGVNPSWSDNGEWIAWTQSTYDTLPGNDHKWKTEIWAARIDGSSLQRVFENSQAASWLPNRLVLRDEKTDQQFTLQESDSTSVKNWPTLPFDFQKVLKEQAAASQRAADFNVELVLKANRLWQNPDLGRFKSIDFTHRMSPHRLDERFQWDQAGTFRVEVVDREAGSDVYGTGWSVIRLPDGSSFTVANPEAYPRHRTADDITKDQRSNQITARELLRRETLRHLSGTRLNFASIDWGRNPNDFIVVDYHQDGNTRLIELRPSPQASRRVKLNAGAMFETTSWAYMHDVVVNRSLLTIDENNRIVREVAYNDEKLIAEINLADWDTTDSGQQAPRHIDIRFPEKDFHVEQKFQVTPEGLWILTSGSSQFAGHPAQKEEIVDLKINASSKSLQEAVQQIRIRHQEMAVMAESRNKVALRGLTPLELGATYAFQGTPETENSQFRPVSLKWIPVNKSLSKPGEWTGAVTAPTAELRFPALNHNTLDSDTNLMLVLYDEDRLPLYSTTVPEAAVTASNRPAGQVLESILDRQQLWLRKKETPLPKTTYQFRYKDEQGPRELPSDNPKIERGITLTLALDSIHRNPELWKMPIQFSASWNGRSVRVLGLNGPHFVHEFGSGLPYQSGRSSYRGGYIKTTSKDLVLVVDAETGFPLVERSADMEIQFLEYVEVTPGQFVPLQILCKTAGPDLDLRFQVLDGKLWLFDREANQKNQAEVSVGDILIDGKAPQQVMQSKAPDSTGGLLWFPWDELTSREPEQAGDRLSASIAAYTKPWTHPSWTTLGDIRVESAPDATQLMRCSLRSYPPLGIARYWTLTRFAGEIAEPLICAETLVKPDQCEVAVAPFKLNQTILVPTPIFDVHPISRRGTFGGSASSETRVRSFSIHHDQQQRAVITPEILSTSYYTGQTVRVTGVLLRDGVVVASGTDSDSFRTYQTPFSSQQSRILLQNSDRQTGTSLLLGHRSVVTSAPAGSTWVQFMGFHFHDFPPQDLLSSRFAEIRQIGLQSVYLKHARDIDRQFRREGHSQRLHRELSDYRDALQQILSDEQSDSPAAIALACRLAGFSENAAFQTPLRALLQHPSESVRDSAAIGLGLLGQTDVIERLRYLASQPEPESETVTDQLQLYTRQHAIWALKSCSE
ncbi:M56 family metallopeptidase [Gimesia sp.]|uniref:M56 family metallopeptidase n=1 Tax=Gimesia sp. TaxID=2024833 RepID=UPI0025C3E644|nr:M56 family metallopeptidase [Gimesia sp.]|tara:strand:- start:334 stop:5658 length:5325 start_codon:yes stop_codon:yes gene_type:complete